MTDENDVLEWISRMDLDAEELGLAANDQEWGDYVYSKLTETFPRRDVDNMYATWLDLAPSVAREAGYMTTYMVDRWGNKVIQYRDLQGKFLSPDVAWAEYSDFIYRMSWSIIP